MRGLSQARLGSDGDVLAPRRAVSAVLGRHPELISRHCTPVACDVRTRAHLYDVDEVEEILAKRARWSPKRRNRLVGCE